MRARRSAGCESCSHRCGLYDAIQLTGRPPGLIQPIQAHFRKHEKICRQGEPVSHALYLVEGTAKLYIEGINGHNIILYLMKPPAYIGLLSFFENVHYSYSVTAIEDARVCMVELSVLKEMYLENHKVLLKLNEAFGKSVALIMNKIICLNQKNIRGRIAETLLYLAQFYKSDSFHMSLTRKELGEMSATSEENTVRLLTELRKEGIISLEGRDLIIQDKTLLQKISELG